MEGSPSALDGSRLLITARITEQKGHFMPPDLLDSQFADLETLGDDEVGAAIPVDGTPKEPAALAHAAVTSS
ncbi:hypothetical protein AB0911_36540 [Streptomyces nigra]|uniref:hypothetical protein n=1 Tax=Streptomyces nigra TaxID=1827580 RepID=UPI0034536A3D